jgi:hypothetical protein
MSRIYDLIAPVLGVGIALALLCVLINLILGRFYKYWMVLAYVAWELLATLGFTVADAFYHGTSPTTLATMTPAQALYARLYWTNDVIVDLFRFVLVIILIYMAAEGSKRVSGHLLAGLVIAMLVLPFVLFEPGFKVVEIASLHIPFPRSAWSRSTSELLNFGAAIMNLMLWGTLLASKRRDPQILLVSLGLGIVVAGTAFAYGVRHLMGESQFKAVGYLFMNLTQLIGWLIWCRAFWPKPKAKKMVDSPVAVQ